MNPFDYAHDLITKENLDEDTPERKDYKTFLINRTLSYHSDIALFINELNRYPDINTQMHFDYVHNAIPKKKRKKKYWAKGKQLENMLLVKEYYKYSNQKCLDTLSVLSDKDIKNIKTNLYKGGSS
ncbi:uncharacterized protein METZ01_LOCUS177276 [marine metagenome]|uniref:DNA polymerase n=1 Tax=marine metagenome TaxID=408172 RepID=A0A382CF45_9ZZZZ